MKTKLRKLPVWSWFWFILGALYFVLPLYATLDFSLRMQRDTLSLLAYQKSFADPDFLSSFLFSTVVAVVTIFGSILLIVPTAYWVRMRLPQARRIVDFITLLPFVVPAIILVFGMIRIYSIPLKIPFTEITLISPLTNSALGTDILLVAGYIVLSLPYMYRSVDTGLRAMDVRTLTEAGQSLPQPAGIRSLSVAAGPASRLRTGGPFLYQLLDDLGSHGHHPVPHRRPGTGSRRALISPEGFQP